MPARINLPETEMAARYKAGESTCELGRAYGVAHRTVRNHLVAAGVKMRPVGAPLGSKHSLGRYKRGGAYHRVSTRYLATLDREGKQCRVHRGCWEAYHGPIPPGFVVHHIDEDCRNNNIENLECLSWSDHLRTHRRPAEADMLGGGR